MAGIQYASRVSVNFRDQWPKLPGKFLTYSFSYDHNMKGLKSGIGLLVLRDQIGTGKLSTTNIGGIYSYRIKINNYLRIRPGLHFMYSQRSIDYQALQFVDQVGRDGVSSLTDPTEKIGFVDVSSSILAYSKDFWAGFTIDHLLRPNQSLVGSDNNIPYKLSLYGGSKFGIKSSMRALKASPESVTWAFNYKMNLERKVPFLEQNSQLDLGVYWHKEPLVLGLWYRGIPLFKKNAGHESIIMLFGYKIEDLTVGYSYDFTISKLVSSTGGAHEISLIYLFNIKDNYKVKRKMIPCPHF